MKRQIVTLASFGACIFAFAQMAPAAECGQRVGGNPDCRLIKKESLGASYCLAPSQLGVVGIDPKIMAWKTSYDIDLKKEASSPSSGAPKCKDVLDFSGAQLKITAKGNNYQVSVTGSAQGKADMNAQMSVVQAGGKDLWLTETNPTHLHHFIFLRDWRMPSGDLPKYVYIQAFDDMDGKCMEDAPNLSTNTIKPGPCPAVNLKGIKLEQTGTGGGGEHS